ncbi:MAG: SIMPL domain-containing protein [Stenomitos rutilans HA7619-LM2]|jgi:hypothetical protein|nr:SIMPL domain-containing protein [Stenomitos rutilans HA7619-LM2]
MNGLNRWMLLPLAIGLLNLSVATPALTQEKRVRTLTVAGDAQVQIPTTMTGINVGIDIRGKEINKVQEEVARRRSAVIALLRARKVQNLETTDVQLEPINDYRSETQNQIVGYRATNTIRFQVPSARVGSVLGEVVEAGANQISSLTLFSSEDVIEAAQKKVIREAFQNAEQKASAALSAMKATQQEVAEVQILAPRPNVIGRVFNYSSNGLTGRVDALDARTATLDRQQFATVVTGAQIVSATVTLTIRY